MDEHGDERSGTTFLARWRALSPWTQYLLGAATFCAATMIWTSVPLDWGLPGAAISAALWVLAPVTALCIWRDVFAHRWGREQIAQAVWVGVASGVLVCVPTGSVPQALFVGPFLGAAAWICAEAGIRDRRKALPPPPLPPPPRVEA